MANAFSSVYKGDRAIFIKVFSMSHFPPGFSKALPKLSHVGITIAVVLYYKMPSKISWWKGVKLSREKFAKLSGVSEKSIYNGVQNLIENNIIQVESKKKSKDRYEWNHYWWYGYKPQVKFTPTPMLQKVKQLTYEKPQVKFTQKYNNQPEPQTKPLVEN
jgi:hypothetical protein